MPAWRDIVTKTERGLVITHQGNNYAGSAQRATYLHQQHESLEARQKKFTNAFSIILSFLHPGLFKEAAKRAGTVKGKVKVTMVVFVDVTRIQWVRVMSSPSKAVNSGAF